MKKTSSRIVKLDSLPNFFKKNELSRDEILISLFLATTENMAINPIFEIPFWDMQHLLKFSRDELNQILNRLENIGF